MLEKVTDKNELSRTIVKHIKKNVLTNCLLYSQDYDTEIETESLFIKEYPSENLIMLKMRDDFVILYFYINDQNAFLSDMSDLKDEIKGKKIVTEIAYKDEQELQILSELFSKMNFVTFLNRICLEKNNPSISEEELADGIHLQSELLDKNIILDFIKDNFDKYTGCIPQINNIEERIANNELLVLEQNFTRKTIGILEFSANNKITIKHLAIDKEYRGKGLAKFLLNTLSSKGKQIITWTTIGSEAEKVYLNSGFMKTRYRSVVLVYEGE